MNCQEALQELESLGTAQNRKIYRRHGVGANLFGVSYANQNQLAKAVKPDHSLARELWATGNHDARVLAAMVADPAQADAALLDSWVDDLDNYVLTDAFAGLAGQTSLAYDKAEQWGCAAAEWPGRAGWLLVARLALKNRDLPDAYFIARLDTIEREIHHRKNRVRDAMNSALIAIGIRNDALEQPALAAAARIGKVAVDHGETGCKTPDAAEYIRRTLTRRRQKAQAGAGRTTGGAGRKPGA